MVRSDRWLLAGIVAAAFLLRLAAGLAKGPDFVENGYSFYADLALTFWDGNGLCYAPDEGCAVRMPLYPVLVAPFLAFGAAYPWLIVFKALVGAAQPLIAYALALRFFDARAARIAAIGVALNPYAIAHGSSFQETSIFNVFITLAVLLLIYSADWDDAASSLTAGLALALASLTTARLILFVPLALLWVFSVHRGSRAHRSRHAVLVAMPVVLLMGGWMARNARVVGAPVLTTEFGLSLWLANHPDTLAYLPRGSIDQVGPVAWAALSEEQRASVEGMSDVGQNRFFRRLALDYVRSNPGDVAYAMLIKVAMNFAGWLSPAREWSIQLGYLALFAPLNALAAAGWWRSRRAGSGHMLIGLLALSFAITTAVFWAHTSHRSVLHVFLIVYAASHVSVEPVNRRT